MTVNGPRGDEFEQVCGCRTFPVRSPIPGLADLPGKPAAPVYLLDLDEVEPNTIAKIINHLMLKFNVPPDEVQREIAENGIPILAEDCTVAILHPQRWF